MAQVAKPSGGLPPPTRPRLQAINQDLSDINQQIHQAAHIIGLPDDWDALEGEERAVLMRRLVRARAEWVLRWILQKFKNTEDIGKQARASPKAWAFLDWMIQTLPVSRCALHLRDADFPTILEMTLEGNFAADVTVQLPSKSHSRRPRDASDSSETMQEESQPSRKRKRGSPGTYSPSKAAAIATTSGAELFEAVKTVVRSIKDKATSPETGEEAFLAEHMNMVLKTEAAQAARILKCWLDTVHNLIVPAMQHFVLDLSPVVDIWELRTLGTDDESGFSAEQYSTECLVPSLTLWQTLHDIAPQTDWSKSSIQLLDRLIARHLLVPAKTAFLKRKATEANEDSTSNSSGSELLSTNLGPLRAKLLQAAQIEDTGEPMPAHFRMLYATLPRLLDLAIRCSPSRTPRSKMTERSWIQAVVVALAECAGCSLQPPEFPTPRAAIIALESCLQLLASHDYAVDAEILKDFFWFYSGLKFPLEQGRVVQWSLVAALIKLDAGIFVPDTRIAPQKSIGRPDDLAQYLFDQISTHPHMHGNSLAAGIGCMELDISRGESFAVAASTQHHNFGIDKVVQEIIVPIMLAFARNRSLMGFVAKWDDQLRKNATASLQKLDDPQPSIWQHRGLTTALAGIFEQTLTRAQVESLFRDHAKRLKPDQKSDSSSKGLSYSAKAYSSTVIVQTMLASVSSDETIDAVQLRLESLWKSYALRVKHNVNNPVSWLKIIWTILSQLLITLWPIHLHGSSTTQKKLLFPLLEQASQALSDARGDPAEDTTVYQGSIAPTAFLLTACDCLQSLPENKDLLSKTLRRVIDSLSTDQLGRSEIVKIVEIVCAEYIHLFECLEQEACVSSFVRLITYIAVLPQEQSVRIGQILSQMVLRNGSNALLTSYITALLKTLAQDDERLQSLVIDAFLQVQAPSIPREQRESALDKFTTSMMLHPASLPAILSVMVRLMEVPNATARISSDGNVLFKITESIHNAQLEKPITLDLLQSLCRLTIDHIIPNKDQYQNQKFLAKFRSNLTSYIREPRQCSSARLALFRGVFLAAHHDSGLISAEEHLTYLMTCLREGSSSITYILDAVNEIPAQILKNIPAIYEDARRWLRTWISDHISVQGPANCATFSPSSHSRPTLHATIAKFQLYPSFNCFVDLTFNLLSESLAPKDRMTVLDTVREFFEPLTAAEKTAVISICTQGGHKVNPVIPYRVLSILLSTYTDKQDDEPELRTRQHAILPLLCSVLGESQCQTVFNALLDAIITIIREKPFLSTQNGIECVLTVLVKLTSRNSPRLSTEHASAMFSRLCETTRLLLLLHRGRLGGRFHLLLPLLQNLLFCLFIPNPGRTSAIPPWLDSVRLTPANASQYTRVLGTLASPTQSSVQRPSHRSTSTKKELNDPVKAAREYASQYVYPLLSSFCRFQLNGRLDPQVRDKLMPGIWEVVNVGMLDKASLDAMFAGLDSSTRDVWRGVWSEWVRVNGRKESVGDAA